MILAFTDGQILILQIFPGHHPYLFARDFRFAPPGSQPLRVDEVELSQTKSRQTVQSDDPVWPAASSTCGNDNAQ